MAEENDLGKEPEMAIVSPAQGRPMLTWQGKQALARVPIFPAQTVETFAPVHNAGTVDSLFSNRLYLGDNIEVLAHLLAEGYREQVKLIYIDPPFDSGANYVRRTRLRHDVDDRRLSGSHYSLGEQIQYGDMWADDNYLQFMYERLPLLRELLAPEGSLWLHCDHRKVHHLRMLLDEVFGPQNYLNTISWRSQVARGAKVNAFYFPFSTHYLQIFAKDRRQTTWHAPKRRIVMSEREASAQYMRDEDGFFRTSDPGTYSFEALRRLHSQNRLYAPHRGEVIVDEQNGRVYASNGGSIAVKYYLIDQGDGTYAAERAIDNLWDDIPGLGTTPQEDTGYPTQKTESLLERVIGSSTDPGDLVLDCFLGSGTTPAVAQKMGRRWIGCDINIGSIQTTTRRLQAIIQQQFAADNDIGRSAAGFAIFRVNNYSVQGAPVALRRLVLEHMGIQTASGDQFFDGSLGSELVKLGGLQRPLVPQDLAAIADELGNRPDEARDVTVICLDMTTAVEQWLAEWNQLRRAGDGVNYMRVIELRSDRRYGQFLVHQPAQARIKIARIAGSQSTIEIEIQDFISPTVVERIAANGGEMKALDDDWRATVDHVAIDPAYDNQVFRAVIADVPKRRTDRVVGIYRVEAPLAETVVAVKLTDVLGEEILVTESV